MLFKRGEGVRVQLIVSGVGGSVGEFGADGVMMYHVYAACLLPYALGIPRDKVQLYCGPAFLVHKGNVESTIGEITPGTVIVSEDTMERNVFPGELAQGEEFFDYFWDIFNRSAPLKADVPLTKCEIRIISGHSATLGGEPAVVCGETVVPFSKLEVVDQAQRNASVLTVLDGCLSPKAVQGLKNPNWHQPPKGTDEFHGVPFPVVCSKKNKSYCFRLSWEGHHLVSNRNDVRFAPLSKVGMSQPIGFPIICSLMFAVKSRYIEHNKQDLAPLFVAQYLSIQRRYYAPRRPFSSEPTPHHMLDNLQRILDDGVVQPKVEASDCLLYSRNNEWFTTVELEASLPPQWGGSRGVG